MTAEEIQDNLIKVLASTVISRRTARDNDTLFQGDKLGHALAIDQLSRQVDAVHVCCKAAGIDEETIRTVISLGSL